MATKKKTTKKNEPFKLGHMETSKKLLLVSYIIAIILTIIVIIGSFMQIDMTHITTIACLSYGELASCNIFYLNKSAKENVPKILSSLSEQFRSQVDINQLLNNR